MKQRNKNPENNGLKKKFPIRNDVGGFNESAAHDGGRAVGCGSLALHSPAVGFPQGQQLLDSHEEQSLGLAEADDHDQENPHPGGKGQALAKPDGPLGAHVGFVVNQVCVLDNREAKTSDTEKWSDHSPAVLHSGPGPTVDHVLNTVIHVINTIYPGNNYMVKECSPQKAHTASCIVVKDIHANLRYHCQPSR